MIKSSERIQRMAEALSEKCDVMEQALQWMQLLDDDIHEGLALALMEKIDGALKRLMHLDTVFLKQWQLFLSENGVKHVEDLPVKELGAFKGIQKDIDKIAAFKAAFEEAVAGYRDMKQKREAHQAKAQNALRAQKAYRQFTKKNL